jgi:hypothetical protein
MAPAGVGCFQDILNGIYVIKEVVTGEKNE